MILGCALLVGLAFASGMVWRGELPGSRASALESPFLAPYPEDQLTDRRIEVVAHQVLARDLTLPRGKTQYFRATFPAELLGADVFVSVTARVRVGTYARQLLVVSDGVNVAHSAPISASEGLQTVTVSFPFRLSKTEFTIAVERSQPVELKELVFLGLADERYERDVCTETEGFVGHTPMSYVDYHENLSYRKPPGRIRIVFVGNSTIDGCKVARGATLSYILQQKLEGLHPGRFEVMNAGIAGASYIGHITSITSYYPMPQTFWPSIDRAAGYQHKQPSIADLAPDILVLAVHWNDLSDFGFLAYGGEERAEGRVSHADIALEAFFDFLDEFSGPNLDHLLSSYRTMTAQPIDFEQWEDYARSHYRMLTERYLERLTHYSPETKVVLLTLPNDRDEKGSTRFEAEIQRGVYADVADERNLPIIDLAGLFRSRFPKKSFRRMYASAYLFDDAIHFSYRGNQWLADRSFRTILTVAREEFGLRHR